MKKETIWNIILVVSLILLFHGLTQTGSPDKKTAQAAQGEAAAGAVGISGFIMKKRAVLASLMTAKMLWVVIGSGVALLVPGFIENIMDIFRPSPTIPVWVWIAGFFVLLMMVLNKK